MKIEIPTSFLLLGITYTVKVIPAKEWEDEESTVGKFYPQTNTIYLVERPTPQQLEHTFFHELAHAILNAMGKTKLYSDEPFIDLLAGLLHQALTTGK